MKRKWNLNMIKGGDYNDYKLDSRISNKIYFPPYYFSNFTAFRLIKTIKS